MVAKITDPGETAQNVAPHLYTRYYLATSNLYNTRLKLAKVLPCTAIYCVQKSPTFDLTCGELIVNASALIMHSFSSNSR